jgi:hypothetical protein
MNAHGTVVPAPTDMSVTIKSSSLSGEFAETVNDPWNKSQVQRTIKAGQTAVSLSYRDNSQLGTFTITASSTGLQSGGVNGTITAGEPTQIVFKSTPQTTYATHTSPPIVIEAQNQFGQATPFTNKRVLRVSSSSSTGSFAQTLPAWDTFRIEWPAGASAIQYYYRDYQAGTHTLSAEMDNLRTPNSSQTTSQTITQPFTVTPQVLDRFIVTNISTPQSTNNNTSVVVIAIDAKGSVVANYDGTVRFITSDPEGKVPQPYTFQPYVDRGSRTFVNAVSFRTPGVHTVTVIDDDNGVLGAQTNIQVIGAMPDNSTTDEGSGESTSRSPDSQGSPNDHDSETNPRSPHAGSSRPPRQPSNESPPQSVASGFSSPISSLLQRFGIDKNLGSRAPLCLIALTMILALVGWSMRTELRHISFLLTIQRRLRQLQNEAQAKQLQVSYAYVVKGVTTATRIRPYYLRLPCYIPVVIALILSLALMHAINRSTLPSTMLFLVLFTIALAYSLLRTRWVKATDRKAAYKLDLEESYLRRQPIAPQGSAQ